MNTQNNDRLNDFIDGILSEEESGKLSDEEREFAEEYTRLLNGLDNNVSVPLDVQANWRKAVRAEAAKQKNSWKRTMLKTVSAVAAALIVLAGATGIMRGNGMLSASVVEKPAYRYMDLGTSDSAEPMMNYSLSVASDGEYEEAAEPEESVAVYEEPVMAAEEMVYDAAPEAVYAAAEFGSADETEYAAANDAMPSPYATIDPADEAVMLARSAEYSALSDDIDADIRLIGELIGENDGYAEKTEKEQNTASIIARIPAENLDTFLISLEGVGETQRSAQFSTNIKENYYDARTRLDALEAEHERLYALIETADAQTLPSLREELENVTARIDLLKSDIAGWETDAAFSKVDITLYSGEKAPAATPEPDLSDRVSQGFSSSWASVKEFLKDMLVALSVIAPAVLVALPVIAVIIILCVAVKKRRKK